TRTLGMIVPNIANPFWSEVVRGVEAPRIPQATPCCSRAATMTGRKRQSTLRLFLAKRVDGVLLTKAAGVDADLVARLRSTRTALVQLMRASPTVSGDKVLVDEEEGSYEGVAHLLRLGYRRVAMINGVDDRKTIGSIGLTRFAGGGRSILVLVSAAPL
ncbi:MAG: substrate-binding domain-containing protein, partial [Acidobacteria bacterium]|nr:substrate-binding domain-containing protein [Acidobacteriota bacterium]